MEKTGKRAILESYRSAMFERAAIEKQMELLHIGGEPGGLHGLSYDREGRGTNEPVLAAVQALEGLEERLVRQVKEIDALAKSFWGLVMSVPDGRDRSVLISYYANGESDAIIAVTLGMNSLSAFRLRHKILEKYFPE